MVESEFNATVRANGPGVSATRWRQGRRPWRREGKTNKMKRKDVAMQSGKKGTSHWPGVPRGKRVRRPRATETRERQAAEKCDANTHSVIVKSMIPQKNEPAPRPPPTPFPDPIAPPTPPLELRAGINANPPCVAQPQQRHDATNPQATRRCVSAIEMLAVIGKEKSTRASPHA